MATGMEQILEERLPPVRLTIVFANLRMRESYLGLRVFRSFYIRYHPDSIYEVFRGWMIETAFFIAEH